MGSVESILWSPTQEDEVPDGWHVIELGQQNRHNQGRMRGVLNILHSW